MTETRTCELCGGPMLNPKAKRFCSQQCSAAVGAALTVKERVTVTCRYCDVTMHVRPSQVARTATCGAPACVLKRRQEGGRVSKGVGATNPKYRNGQWTRIEKACEVCGATFIGPARRRFCSPPCAAKNKATAQAGQVFSEERKARMKGKSGSGPKSEAWKAALAERMTGPGNPGWLGIGKESRSRRDRGSHLYREWRTAVLGRDGSQCRHCAKATGLIAHHIQEWWDAPAERYTVKNGITLCMSCHRGIHNGKITLPKT